MEKQKTKSPVLPDTITKQTLKEKPVDTTTTSFEDAKLTMLYCRYSPSNRYASGWWCNIHLTAYIQDAITGNKLSMISSLNIPVAPARHYFKCFNDSLTFILVFPKIPKSWVVFDFIEGHDKTSFTSYGILRNDSGIYRIIVKCGSI